MGACRGLCTRIALDSFCLPYPPPSPITPPLEATADGCMLYMHGSNHPNHPQPPEKEVSREGEGDNSIGERKSNFSAGESFRSFEILDGVSRPAGRLFFPKPDSHIKIRVSPFPSFPGLDSYLNSVSSHGKLSLYSQALYAVNLCYDPRSQGDAAVTHGGSS